MKALKIFIVLALVAGAGVAGWFLGRNAADPRAAEAEGRKIKFYQSPMHPWIKSDQPGNCTICGMKLTPVYEGEKGFDMDPSFVALSSNQVNVINVQTEEIDERELGRTIEVAGKIEADETRNRVISAYFDGRVEKLHVNFTGAEVEAGEPLAILYSPNLLTAEQEFEFLLSQPVPTNSARLVEEHERLVEATRQRLRRLGLTDAQIANLTNKTATNLTSEIVAPMSGTVVNKAVVEGMYVKEGDKLFEIADLSTMWFRFDVYERDLPWITIGQKVEVTVPALPGKVFHGEVRFVEPTVNDATRSAKVRVVMDNPVGDENGGRRRLLYNNLYAEGIIRVKTAPHLAVSRRAVLQPGDTPRVYVENEGVYERRDVKLGRRGDHYWEVVDGLEAGDKVVTEGNLMIDSQAELNLGAQAGSHDHGSSSQGNKAGEPAQPVDHAHAHISAEQGRAAGEFMEHAAKASEALAADNLQGYEQAVPGLAESLVKLKTAFAGSPFQSLVDKIEMQRDAAGSLKQTRAQFLGFSNAAADLAQELKKHTTIKQRVFKCPMYPKAGQTGYWVQTGGTTRNPFYGSEMLDCGSEVK